MEPFLFVASRSSTSVDKTGVPVGYPYGDFLMENVGPYAPSFLPEIAPSKIPPNFI